MQAAKEVPVRYGSNYKVAPAIVLPCLSIIPFIGTMHMYVPTDELTQYITIYTFLAFLILFTILLVKNIYPPAMLSIESNKISLRFTGNIFLRPGDFSVNIKDIISFTTGEMGGDEYMRLKTKAPSRKFQLSASSYSEQDNLAFNNAMFELSELISGNANNT